MAAGDWSTLALHSHSFTVLLFFSQDLIYSDSDTANMSCHTGQGGERKGREKERQSIQILPIRINAKFWRLPQKFPLLFTAGMATPPEELSEVLNIMRREREEAACC